VTKTINRKPRVNSLGSNSSNVSPASTLLPHPPTVIHAWPSSLLHNASMVLSMRSGLYKNSALTACLGRSKYMNRSSRQIRNEAILARYCVLTKPRPSFYSTRSRATSAELFLTATSSSVEPTLSLAWISVDKILISVGVRYRIHQNQ
jgi:hypothetical protein